MDSATVMTAQKSLQLAFAALDMAALFYDHARRSGATPTELAEYRKKALMDLAATDAEIRASEGPAV